MLIAGGASQDAAQIGFHRHGGVVQVLAAAYALDEIPDVRDGALPRGVGGSTRPGLVAGYPNGPQVMRIERSRGAVDPRTSRRALVFCHRGSRHKSETSKSAAIPRCGAGWHPARRLATAARADFQPAPGVCTFLRSTRKFFWTFSRDSGNVSVETCVEQVACDANHDR